MGQHPGERDVEAQQISVARRHRERRLLSRSSHAELTALDDSSERARRLRLLLGGTRQRHQQQAAEHREPSKVGHDSTSLGTQRGPHLGQSAPSPTTVAVKE